MLWQSDVEFGDLAGIAQRGRHLEGVWAPVNLSARESESLYVLYKNIFTIGQGYRNNKIDDIDMGAINIWI